MATNARAFSVFSNASIKVVSGSNLATLRVPDGSWVIFAKMNVDNDDAKAVHTVDCRLNAGIDFDQNVVRLYPSGTNSVDMGALSFNVVHTFPGTSAQPKNDITLVCVLDKEGSNVAAGRIKITAIEVGALSNKAA